MRMTIHTHSRQHKRSIPQGGLQRRITLPGWALKDLEEENRKLKKLLVELMLDVAALREGLGKKLEPRIAESVRDLGDRRQALLAAPRLWPDRARPEDLSLRVPSIRQPNRNERM